MTFLNSFSICFFWGKNHPSQPHHWWVISDFNKIFDGQSARCSSKKTKLKCSCSCSVGSHFYYFHTWNELKHLEIVFHDIEGKFQTITYLFFQRDASTVPSDRCSLFRHVTEITKSKQKQAWWLVISVFLGHVTKKVNTRHSGLIHSQHYWALTAHERFNLVFLTCIWPMEEFLRMGYVYYDGAQLLRLITQKNH